MTPFRLLLIIGWLALTSACAVNPVTGEQELSLVPESQELAIGAEHYRPAQQSQGGVYTVDPDVDLYVQTIGNKLAAVSDRDLPYEFVVINDSTPNAWALPGGKIAINRGLLTELDNEAELAAVLGHEVVHAAARHGAQAMQRGMLLQGALLAATIGAASSDSEYANYIVGGAQLGAQLINQSYSREAELEADYYGMQYMKRAGYNPEAAVSLQQTFVELSRDRKTNWLQGLFASHPPSAARVEANRETARALGRSGEIDPASYRESLSHLFQTQDAYSAFDQAMGLAREGHYDDALSFVDRALSIEPAEPRFYGLKGDILLERKDFKAAMDQFDQALARDDGYYEYYLGRGLALAELGQTDKARQALEQSRELLPTAIASERLGDLYLAAGNDDQAKRYYGAAMEAPDGVGERAKRAFTRLDLLDRPARYLPARPFTENDGTLRAIVGNSTAHTVNNVAFEFKAIVNGKAHRKIVTVSQMGPNSRGRINSGWRFDAGDAVESVTVEAVEVRSVGNN